MANLTTIPLEDSFETSLTQELSSTGLTINVAGVPSFTFPASNTTYLVLSPGQITMEIVEIESFSSGASTITIKTGGRNQDKGNGVTSSAQTHTVGSKAIISDNFAFWNDIKTAISTKVNSDSDTTVTGVIDFTTDNNGSFITVTSMTTTVRDTISSPVNGTIIYNTTTGTLQFRDGGAWSDVGSATVNNASETVAGIIELSTNAEMGTGVSTGGTGARLIPPNDQLVKTSSGSGDENKIPVLDATGKLAAGFVNALSTSLIDAKGDIIGGTANDAVDRVPAAVSNDQVLVSDSGETTGLKFSNVPIGASKINGTGTLTIDTTASTNITHGLGGTPIWGRFTVIGEGDIDTAGKEVSTSSGVINGSDISCVFSGHSGTSNSNLIGISSSFPLVYKYATVSSGPGRTNNISIAFTSTQIQFSWPSDTIIGKDIDVIWEVGF